jgi:hypothetical protein
MTLLTPEQIRRIRGVTDSLQLDWDAVVVPLAASATPLERVMVDGKLLVRPPGGAAFDSWFTGLRVRLAALELDRVPRAGVPR